MTFIRKNEEDEREKKNLRCGIALTLFLNYIYNRFQRVHYNHSRISLFFYNDLYSVLSEKNPKTKFFLAYNFQPLFCSKVGGFVKNYRFELTLSLS
jgi:hypothetical protein